MCLAQGHSTVTQVMIEPAALRSRVKHYTTEPLRSRTCNSITASFDLRNVRITAYLKGIMEVYRKTITGLGP